MKILNAKLFIFLILAIFALAFLRTERFKDWKVQTAIKSQFKSLKEKSLGQKSQKENGETQLDLSKFLKVGDLIDANKLQGKASSFFAPLSTLQSSLKNFILNASRIRPGIFGGKTDYTFPGNLKIAGGQIYLTPVSDGITQEGVIYYDQEADKLYLRGSSSWIDLTQQDTDTTISSLAASSITSGTFGGSSDYSFPASLNISGGQLYFTPVSTATEKEGIVYYDSDVDKLYVRGASSWIDLTQQDTDTDSKNPTGATLVVAASNSKDSSRADYVADGTADQSEIQTAIDALPSSGGKVVLLEGTYNISSAITLKSNLEIAGQGWGTRLVLQSATNFFKWDDNYDQNSDGKIDPGGTALSDIYIHDLELDGNKSSLSQPSNADADAGVTSAIKIFNSSRIHLTNLYLHDMVASYAILLKGVDIGLGIDTAASDAFVHDNVFRSIGSGDQNNGAVYSDLDNTIISNNIVDTISGNGFNIDVADEGLITDNIIQNVTASSGDEGYAIVTGYGASEITIANNIIAGTSRGIANHIGGSSVGDNHIIVNNILRDSTSARDYAIKLQDDGHTVSNNRITNWAHVGIYLDAVQNTVVSNNVINSSGAGNTSGIEIKTGSHNIIVSNNIIFDMGTTASKGHGITLSSGTDLNNVLISANRAFDSGAGVQTDGILLYAVPSTSTIQIVDNYLVGNDVAVKTDGGAALSSTVKAIRNRGFVTENSGTATISSGNTSVDVSHGLNLTPTAQDIKVAPTNNLGDAAKFWLSDVGASTFKINVNVDPGASTATFSWSAQIF